MKKAILGFQVGCGRFTFEVSAVLQWWSVCSTLLWATGTTKDMILDFFFLNMLVLLEYVVDAVSFGRKGSATLLAFKKFLFLKVAVAPHVYMKSTITL